jgi:hypothetical protein
MRNRDDPNAHSSRSCKHALDHGPKTFDLELREQGSKIYLALNPEVYRLESDARLNLDEQSDALVVRTKHQKVHPSVLLTLSSFFLLELGGRLSKLSHNEKSVWKLLLSFTENVVLVVSRTRPRSDKPGYNSN